MLLTTKALSRETLEKSVLQDDKKKCRRFGPCGVGKKALYLNSFYVDRMYYVPISAIRRVFKRVAMSKGGFTGKGMFATLPYLVVVYDDGTEKQCLFKHEEHVDEMLAYIGKQHLDIPLLSVEGEKKQRERAEKEAARPRPVISKEAEKQIKELEKARNYLEKHSELTDALSRAAKAKRVNACTNSSYRWVALAIVLMGVVTFLYGIYAVVTKVDSGVYFLLFGLAIVFLFAGANVLPTKRNNKAYIDQKWREACEEVAGYIKGYPDFPLPERYAHPVTLTRMIRVISDGHAKEPKEALEVVKEDLKALNADVQVEQEEYDEIMAIKPMFLIEDYR